MAFIVHEANVPNQYQAPTSDQHHRADVRSRLNYGRQLGRERSRNIGREQVVPSSNFNGSIHASGRIDAQQRDSHHKAREHASLEPRNATSDIRASRATSSENVVTTQRGLPNVTVVWGEVESQHVVQRVANSGGGGKAEYKPIQMDNTSSDGFPWGALLPLGVGGLGLGQMWVGSKMRKSENKWVRLGGNIIYGTGAVEFGAPVAACLAQSGVIKVTPAGIVTPRPTDTARPPEAKPTRVPEMTLNYLKDPTINSPLADWNTIPSSYGPWIHAEDYKYDTQPNGELTVYYDADGTKYAFAVNPYIIPTGVVPAPGVIEADYGKFYMMLRQKGNDPIEAMILLDPNQDKKASLPIDAGVYHYPTGSGLEKEQGIMVHIEKNSEGKPMYTVIRNGEPMPLTDKPHATSAIDPTPQESDIFNVAYLDKDPFQFGGEVSLPPEATATAAGIAVETGGETIMMTTNVKYSEVTKLLDFDPSKVQTTEVPDANNVKIRSYIDNTNLRYIWNPEINAWAPDILFSSDLVNPENSHLFKDITVVDKGSAELSSLLYYAEHPGCIPESAVDPHYKINVGHNYSYLSLFRENQQLWPDRKDSTRETQLTQRNFEKERPFCWAGMFRVKDKSGNEIYVMAQLRKNSPTTDNPAKVMPVFFGFDKSAYEKFYLSIDGRGNPYIVDLIENNYYEIVPVFPPPSAFGGYDSQNFNFKDEEKNPNVARLLSQSIYSIFSAAERNAINTIFNNYFGAVNKFSSPDQPFSTEINTLPMQFSRRIFYPGYISWIAP